MVITSGSYGKIQVNAQSTQSTQEVQEGGTECEDLYAKMINGGTRGENTTAIEKEFMAKIVGQSLSKPNLEVNSIYTHTGLLFLKGRIFHTYDT